MVQTVYNVFTQDMFPHGEDALNVRMGNKYTITSFGPTTRRKRLELNIDLSYDSTAKSMWTVIAKNARRGAEGPKTKKGKVIIEVSLSGWTPSVQGFSVDELKKRDRLSFAMTRPTDKSWYVDGKYVTIKITTDLGSVSDVASFEWYA